MRVVGKNKFEGRWFWCGLCKTAAIQCDACKNTSCNGGGCVACDKDFVEAIRMVYLHQAPPKHLLEVKNDELSIAAEFG